MTQTPRIAPLATSDLSEQHTAVLEPYGEFGSENVFRTMARHPDLLRAWTPLIRHVLARSSLSYRTRELLILRTAVLWHSDYEWAQHIAHGRRAGLSELELVAVIEGPDSPTWSPPDWTLLRAADDLVEDGFIAQDTWVKLALVHDEKQMIDIVITVGQYSLVAMALKSFGVPLDARLPREPALRNPCY